MRALGGVFGEVGCEGSMLLTPSTSLDIDPSEWRPASPTEASSFFKVSAIEGVFLGEEIWTGDFPDEGITIGDFPGEEGIKIGGFF